MLNISRHSISSQVPMQEYSAFQRLEARSVSKVLLRIIYLVTFLAVVALFLPWTQNIRSTGYVTTLNPDDKPQTVQSIIDGKVEEWFVQEGDYVQQGDTIMKVTEAKEEYLDPQLLERTEGQINAKAESVKAYAVKAENLNAQYEALLRNKEVKLEQNEIKIEQTRFKMRGDSMDLQAAEIAMNNAKNQMERTQELYEQGIKSLTELENKRAKYQQAQAKVSLLQNKLAASQNEIFNLEANRFAIISDFDDKIAKSRSDRMSALSDSYTAEASVNKLQSDYNKYKVRVENYYVRSPIDGIITQAIKDGIGELIKSGEALVSIIPVDLELAVEAYIEPNDVPLLKRGQEVRIQFDGWPAIVFSGWPNSSFGTFPGRVFAIDNFISDNGKYRVLISQDENGAAWPEEVRVGGGAMALMLLNDVPLYYELWRQLNGFPADYYENGEKAPKGPKMKAPIKKVK